MSEARKIRQRGCQRGWRGYCAQPATMAATNKCLARSNKSNTFAPSCGDAPPNVYHLGMFIVPHGAPEGYEWFVTLVVLVGLYFAVRNFMRVRR
jgi:hypothetical protein